MQDHEVVSRDAWLAARTNLLAQEKALTRERDALSAQRRALPWVRVEKPYTFEGAHGRQTLPQIFQGRSQLVVYHFMFDPAWETGCKSCAFWADNFNGIPVHLAQRDVTFAAISRAPFAKLAAFKARMGWEFTWLSSEGSDFNFDYGVSFRPADVQAGTAEYNYAPLRMQATELPGISVFCRDAAGSIFHTYSTYGRGVEMVNGAYHFLDLVPKGRDEAGLERNMAWVRLHDMYAPDRISTGG